MKKIALCISGQPRFVEEGYEKVLKPFVLDGNDVDVFIHSWIPDEEQIGKPYINAGGHPMGKEVEEGIFDTVSKLYNPTRTFYEKQRFFEFGKYAERTLPHIRSDYLFSMFYSIWKSNNILNDYIIETGIEYDWVVRSRFDVQLNKKIDFNLNASSILVPYGCWSDEGLVDCFAYSNKSNMDIYCNLYNNIDYIMHSSDIGFCCEFILKQYLDTMKIDVQELFWHSIYR